MEMGRTACGETRNDCDNRLNEAPVPADILAEAQSRHVFDQWQFITINSIVEGQILTPLAIRVWMTAVLMSFGSLGTAWVRSASTFEIKALDRSLDKLPTELDGYQSTEIPIDDHILEILKADSVGNRRYVGPNGTSILCHLAAWIRPESVLGAAPHLPKVCYTNSGWKIIGERAAEISTPSGRLALNLLLVERDRNRSVVAYWYQIGNSTYTTSADAKRIQRNLWGKKQWPALIKVMLDTPAQDIDTALPRIESFATSVFMWTQDR